MENKIRLSFIIPLYNVEKYIEECVKSLFEQDIPKDEYEVIIVNDCSTDNSREIVLELLTRFPNIVFIEHNINKRQGAARNTGLAYAKGKYIWFIDSDDYLKPNVLKYMLTFAENNNLDILHFNFTRVIEGGDLRQYSHTKITPIGDGNSFFFNVDEVWWKKGVEVWRRIHKKSFLIDNKLIFEEDTSYEDVIYSIQAFNAAKRVIHLNISPYFYRLNINSFLNKPTSGTHLYESIVIANKCLNLVKAPNLDKRYTPILINFSNFHLKDVIYKIPQLSDIEKDVYKRKMKDISWKEFNGFIKWNQLLVIFMPDIAIIKAFVKNFTKYLYVSKIKS